MFVAQLNYKVIQLSSVYPLIKLWVREPTPQLPSSEGERAAVREAWQRGFPKQPGAAAGAVFPRPVQLQRDEGRGSGWGRGSGVGAGPAGRSSGHVLSGEGRHRLSTVPDGALSSLATWKSRVGVSACVRQMLPCGPGCEPGGTSPSGRGRAGSAPGARGRGGTCHCRVGGRGPEAVRSRRGRDPQRTRSTARKGQRRGPGPEWAQREAQWCRHPSAAASHAQTQPRGGGRDGWHEELTSGGNPWEMGDRIRSQCAPSKAPCHTCQPELLRPKLRFPGGRHGGREGRRSRTGQEDGSGCSRWLAFQTYTHTLWLEERRSSRRTMPA